MEFDLTTYIPYLIHQSHLAIFDEFSVGLAERGISLPEWRIATVLAHHGRIRFGDLAGAAGIEPPTLARMLTAMEGKELALRQPSMEDRRATDVLPTDAGIALVASLVPLAEKVQAKALAGFTADETEFLRRLLRRMKDNVAPPK
ncbi:MarR family winged helix-turn-helix transcriptional regulator [Noviherbaspirillum humi]|uniref:MarR family winged helix-turn-helix transcriptional regulator n=1 Tax=Noviherbaspirillum humi TaxID=1688639 RepID=UPI001595EE95|nr:MarR family transcriptional regulator [Noviherbaspirillum humi]